MYTPTPCWDELTWQEPSASDGFWRLYGKRDTASTAYLIAGVHAHTAQIFYVKPNAKFDESANTEIEKKANEIKNQKFTETIIIEGTLTLNTYKPYTEFQKQLTNLLKQNN